METITSRANAKIKYAAALKKADFRRSEGCILVEGVRLCEDAARNGVRIAQCFITEKLLEKDACKTVVAAAEECFLIAEHIAEKLSDTKTPQGIFCVCRQPQMHRTLPPEGKFILLENLQDPGNLGTAIRTAEAFGLTGAILCGCCDAFSPKAMRASMGAGFRFLLFEDNDYCLVEDFVCKGIPLYCAVVDTDAADVRVLREKQSMIVAVGNEGNGLSQKLRAMGEPITIHMAGRAESLNAAQAATVLMYEMSL